MMLLSLLLALAVAVTPLYQLRLTVGSIPFYLPEVFIIASAVVWVVGVLTRRTRLAPVPLSLILPVLFFLLGSVIATYFGGSESYGGLKSWVIMPIIFGFLSIQSFADHSSSRRHLEGGLLISALGVSLWGIGDVALNGGRLNSFFNSPNAAAMWLVPVFFILLPGFRKSRLDLLILLVVVLAIGLTQSFGGYLALASGLATLIIFRRLNQLSGTVVSALALLVFSYLSLTKYLALLLTPLFGERLGGRLQIWLMGRDAIETFGYWGFGPGRFESFYLSKVGMTFANPVEWNVPQPHNLYLATWLSAGLLGLVSFLWLLVALVVRQLKNKQFFLLAALVAIAVHGLVDTTYWKNDLAIIFFLVAALTFVPTPPLASARPK